MAELVEYHGWAVLYCRFENWSDDEWAYARDEVSKAVASLTEEDGHAAHVNWPANGGSVVALNGWDDSAEAPLRVLRRIAEVAPHSYGELLVFPNASLGSPVAKRYRMHDGLLEEASVPGSTPTGDGGGRNELS